MGLISPSYVTFGLPPAEKNIRLVVEFLKAFLTPDIFNVDKTVTQFMKALSCVICLRLRMSFIQVNMYLCSLDILFTNSHHLTEKSLKSEEGRVIVSFI